MRKECTRLTICSIGHEGVTEYFPFDISAIHDEVGRVRKHCTKTPSLTTTVYSSESRASGRCESEPVLFFAIND